ncbi:Ribosomal protein L20 family-containing protein [Strongyloides ratti]|uniref:Ribosomal protein L20 family-containing protein n=1 Tax=Strongyloides ratti TaxID=34506 RepID=A0A090KX91_STRRB|nr:Ribosomal protein L20 family-containing protein [Strongyloides ratti]CEF62115.1 Ribosomal protein L20 family-containing protein [Strongyloides ratti]
MKLSSTLNLRRILNSPFNPFHVIPKQDKWKSREKLARFTAWQYGSERNTVKGALRKLNKVFHYMTMQRHDEIKLNHFYAEQRISSALKEHNFDYPNFKNSLNKGHILLDNVVLSQLAMYEPRSFQSIVLLAKKMNVLQDKPTIVFDNELENVEIFNNFIREPLPLPKLYPKGPSENHTSKPRRICQDEY